jgi:hypothetical protein
MLIIWRIPTRTMTAVRISCAVAHLLSFGLVPVFTSSVFPGNPHVSLVFFLSAPRSSRRRSTAPHVMNVGPENREPSRQIGYAQSSLSPAASSKSELEAAVAGLLKIKKAHPEYDAALHAAIQVMTDQDFTIDFLSRALADVRCQLKALLVDLVLDDEVQDAIDIMQSGILIILDMLELDDDVIQLGDDAASSSSSSSSSFSSSSSPPSSSFSSPPSSSTTATTTTHAAELKSSLTKVYHLVNRGKTEQARRRVGGLRDRQQVRSACGGRASSASLAMARTTATTRASRWTKT